ncbi:RcnB family protein [Roseateles sp. DAIF2]|uniref:RcnB family protein n=1 Tax=Roseateles sp. DAIF2 TaxID=2714952 RepID=UPI0018C1A0FD|nr:RcnB family protein [Roseateles sp. DAIF2]QPF73816.1 RcnB family protein [Roseateles sp. DAIF2]
MKSLSLFRMTLMAFSLCLGSMAQAQGGPSARGAEQRSERGSDRHAQRDRDRQDERRANDRRDRQPRYEQFRNDHYHSAAQGTNGYGRSWRRGDRLPQEYRGRHYVVEDWRGHHLYAPPRGYHWVQNGGDYVLVAIATGLIVSILLSN